MNTTADILYANKHTVWVRVTDLHPHRILTLDRQMLPNAEIGTTIQVEVRSGIEARMDRPGWTAMVVERGSE
jgi:hypothetical protein